MNANNRNTACNECFGLGSKEFLIVLEIPELDGNGKLIRYARKTFPCAACPEIKTSRLARPESPTLREAVKY